MVPTATTDPAGLEVGLTYNGVPTAPTAVGSYAVVASVVDGNHTGSATGTLVIAAESIATWRTSHFTTAEIAAGLAADGADPDSDGFTNAQEYVLGTNPRGGDPQPLAIIPAAGHFTLSFLARRAAGSGYAGLTRKYAVEASGDLANWQNYQSNILGADQTVTLTPPGDAGWNYYRLNVRLE